jgi:hypothetical protein
MKGHDEDTMRIPDCHPTSLREPRDPAATGQRESDEGRDACLP